MDDEGLPLVLSSALPNGIKIMLFDEDITSQ